MLFIFSNSVVLLSGCGAFDVDLNDDHVVGTTGNTTSGIDEEILPYYEKFSSIYNVNIDHIPANLVDIDRENVAGTCTSHANGDREIVIDRSLWEGFTDTKREIVIFHELGHCFFGRGHTEETMKTETFGEIPKSVMHPFVIRDIWYSEFNSHYIDELHKD